MLRTVAPRNQRGLIMLDALLALSVLTLSLWSVQQLLAHRLQQAHQQRNQAQAITLLDDLAQRIRIHALRFGYASAQQRFAIGLHKVTGSAVDTCQVRSCNAADFANWVLSNWSASARGALPDASLRIQVQGQRLQLLIAWRTMGATSFTWRSMCPDRYDCEVLWL